MIECEKEAMECVFMCKPPENVNKNIYKLKINMWSKQEWAFDLSSTHTHRYTYSKNQRPTNISLAA